MSMRRFTRLTNAFSKKAENHAQNHAHAVALHFMHYNFVRIHQTLRCPPAMRAGVTDRLRGVVDMVKVVESWKARQVQVAAWTLPFEPRSSVVLAAGAALTY